MRFKPDNIPTPLRTIELEYNSEADLSQLELDALDKYIDLHRELFVIKRDWEAMREDQKVLQAPQQQILQQLDRLKEEVKLYRHLAGFTKEEVEQMPEPDEKQAFDPGELVQHGLALQALFEVHYEATRQLSGRFKELEDRTDALKEHYDDFDDNYFLPVIQNYQTMEIDIIRLDEDFNEFNILMDDLTDLIRATIDERNVVTTAYNEMVQDMDIAFKRIERVTTEINNLKTDDFEGEADLN